MFERGAMLFLYTVTATHVGSGETATADLAIQRNPTLGWPMIQASSLKGALRDAAPAEADADAWKSTVAFGYDPQDKRSGRDARLAELQHACGALAIGDAELLAFPVASLAGIFAWVTCPAALRGLQ